LTQKEIYDNYGYIIDDLRDGYYIKAVKSLFHVAGDSFPPIDNNYYNDYECAKAFLIALIYDKYEHTINAKIIFNAIGLYDETKSFGKVARRVQFILLTEYKGTKTDTETISTPNKDLPQEMLNKMADSLSKVEKTNLYVLLNHFIKMPLKQEFFYHACERYTCVVSGKSYRCVDSSRFRLSSINSKPIFFIKALKNKEFFGREEELKTLEENFRNHNSAQIIYGMGGVGKTQIALQYAYLHKNDYDAIIWLGASNFAEIINNCKLFIKSYGINKNNESIKNSIELLNIFRDSIFKCTRCLIIFDNVDYIDKTTQEARKALNTIASIITENSADFLITTRCDRVFRGITRIRIDTFTPDIAVGFLEKKTKLQRNNSSERLAKKLGYLPLALDYAGAYISVQNLSYQDYLDLWNKYGMRLFDNDSYAESTVRQAFHITLDKIIDNSEESKAMLHLLNFCAEFEMEYLPLKEYIEMIREDMESEKAYYRKLLDSGKEIIQLMHSPDKNDDSDCYYKLVDCLFDGSLKYECITEPYQGVIAIDKADTYPMFLLDDLKRGEIIRKLYDYSLISWDGKVIVVHPLLEDIIWEESTEIDGYVKRDPLSAYSNKAILYKRFGDKERALSYEYSALCEELSDIKLNIMLFQDRYKIASQNIAVNWVIADNVKDNISRLIVLIDRILEYSDDDLTKRFVQVLFCVTDTFYAMDNIIHCKDDVLRYEEIFFEKLSQKLGNAILWKRKQTPEEKRINNGLFCIEHTDLNKTFENSPRLSSASAAIDKWIVYDENFVSVIDSDIKWRVAAIK